MPRLATCVILAMSVLHCIPHRPVFADAIAQWSTADGGNGHYYEFVSSPNVSWHDANIAADATSFLGSVGHLVTVTSQTENDFLKSAFGSLIGDPTPAPGSPVVPGVYAWIGLNDQQTLGVYQWVTNEPFSYSNWGIGEPSGPQGYPDQQYIYYWQRDFGNGPNFSWDDTVNSPPLVGYDAYILEFDGPFIATPVPSTLVMSSILFGIFSVVCLSRR